MALIANVPPAAPYGNLLPLYRRIYANAHVALLDRILTQAQGSSRSLASWLPTRHLPSRHAITIWHSIDYDVYLDTLDDLPERLPCRVGHHVLQQHSPPTRYASRPVRRRRRHLRTWVLLVCAGWMVERTGLGVLSVASARQGEISTNNIADIQESATLTPIEIPNFFDFGRPPKGMSPTKIRRISC